MCVLQWVLCNTLFAGFRVVRSGLTVDIFNDMWYTSYMSYGIRYKNTGYGSAEWIYIRSVDYDKCYTTTIYPNDALKFDTKEEAWKELAEIFPHYTDPVYPKCAPHVFKL